MKKLIALLFIIIPISLIGQEFMNYADSVRKANNIPALGFAVIKADTILLAKVIGVRKINSTDTATITDRFHLGSNTKAITSFIAGKLIEEGKIKWDTKLLDLFPEWKEQCRRDYQQITLQDLLSHRARIQPFTNGAEFLRLPKWEGTNSERRFAFSKWLLARKPVKQKDKIYVYSNAGYTIASVMLEKVSGKSWEELVIENLEANLSLQPGFSWPNLISSQQPWGHQQEGHSLVATPPNNPYKLDPLIAPAGDINMTLTDYAKFIQQNLKGLLGKESYLSQKTLEFIHYGVTEYAMGWGWAVRKDEHTSSHNGSAGTFYCHVIIIKEKDLAIIVVANSAEDKAVNGIYELRKKLMKMYGS